MPSDETRIVIDAVSEAVEQPDEVIESKDPRLELYNGGKLVKRWRLPGKDNRIRVELVRNSPEQGVIDATDDGFTLTRSVAVPSLHYFEFLY